MILTCYSRHFAKSVNGNTFCLQTFARCPAAYY